MKLVALQYLRAVAAICVVLYHAGFYLSLYRSSPAYANALGHDLGTFGVFAFFALSGFLMAVQLAKPDLTASRFLLHRLLRVFPIFWIVCAAKILVVTSAGYGVQFDPLALSLAPVGERNYVLGIEWTLVYEVFFYFLVTLIILLRLRDRVNLIAALWLGAIVLACFLTPGYAPQFAGSLIDIPLSSTCAAFAAGMLIPFFLQLGVIRQSALPLGLFLFALSRVEAFGAFGNVGVGIGCALIVAWCATVVDTAKTHSPVLAKLGDWSFSIYLVHVPICTTLLLATASLVSPLAVWWIIVAAVLIVGGVFGAFDIWLYRRLRSWGDSLPSGMQAAIGVAFALSWAGAMVLSEAAHIYDSRLPPELAGLEGAASSAEVEVALQKAGYAFDGGIRGSLDILREGPGGVLIGGWMNDPTDIRNHTALIVVGNDASAFVAFPRDYRFDVIAAYGVSGFLMPFAFNYTIKDATCTSGSQKVGVIVSQARKTYGTPSLIACSAM